MQTALGLIMLNPYNANCVVMQVARGLLRFSLASFPSRQPKKAMSWGGLSSQTVGSTQPVASPDLKLPDTQADGISSLAFAPSETLNLVAAGSWDNSVRLWNLQEQASQGLGMASQSPGIMATPIGEIKHQGPVLDVCMSPEGNVFSAGCDNKAMMWTPNPAGGAPQTQQIAEHSAPIKCIAHVPQLPCIVTGSWDQTVKFWDMRQSSPAHQFQLPHKITAMDCRYPYLCVATSNKEVYVYNLAGGIRPLKPGGAPIQSQIKAFQTRCLSMFPDCSGFAIGNIEGRVAIHYIDHRQGDKTVEFAYKCHRIDAKDTPNKTAEIYAVNSISFHNRYGTFATAGADGSYAFWDKDKRQRLKAPTRFNAPISCASFNHRGDLYGYAVSYDWSKGSEHYNKQQSNDVFIHVVKEDEIKPKKK